MTARYFLLLPAALLLLAQNETVPPQTSAAPAGTQAPVASAVPKEARKPTAAARSGATGKLTPMGQRIAIVAVLNKQNGIARDIRLRPGQAVRLGGVIVRLRACETTPSWEKPPLTGAFLQVDAADAKGRFHRIFSGWNYAETPSLNPVAHPVYDVWVKSCEMSFPDTGPETVSVASPAAAPRPAAQESSAEKSAPVAETASPSND